MSLFEEFCFGKPLKKTHKRNQSVICVERDLVPDLDEVNKPDDNSAPPVPKNYVDTPDCYYELIGKHVDEGDFVWTCESDLYEACSKPHVEDHTCVELDPLEPMLLLGQVIAYGGTGDYVVFPSESPLAGLLCLQDGTLSWRSNGSEWVTIQEGLDATLTRYLEFK